MRILHTPVRFYPAVGGVEKYVFELAKEQVKQGHTVTVVCANEPLVEAHSTVEGVNVIRLDYKHKLANTNITWKLFRTLMSQDFDVVHTQMPTPWSADISALVAWLKKKPLILSYQNDIEGKGLSGVIAKVYNQTFLKLLMHRAKKIIITQPDYLNYSPYLRPYKNKVVTIPVGVSKPQDIKTLKKNKNQLFFLSVLDKYHEYKGLDIIMPAMKQVKSEYPDVKLIVGGNGELADKYDNEAKKLGLGKSIKFLGFVPDKELPNYYATSAVFLLPSTSSREGFGIVALEAMSYRTPVITTQITGSAEYVKTKKAGLVIPPNDVDALSKAILAMLKSPKSTNNMGRSGAKAVSRDFNWKEISKNILNTYLVNGDIIL